MPQMAPMSWLMLFLTFTTATMIMAMMNYYLYMPTMQDSKTENNTMQKKMNWKW